jgi:type III pantothenate kinase
MLLAIDIGNTNTVFGFYDDRKLLRSYRIATEHAQTVDEAAVLVRQFQQISRIDTVDAVAIASVVPKCTPIYQRLSGDYFQLKPLFITHKVKLNVTFDYPKPSEIGADRICNSAAAFDSFGGPVIVVDFGTATTFDIISSEGAYLGGIIAPGIESAQAALSQRAAQLFKVSIQKPDSAIGKSTEEAMIAGSFLGAVGQVDYIIRAITAELKVEPKVVATGGLAGVVTPESKLISGVAPDITLDGIRLIYEFNHT